MSATIFNGRLFGMDYRVWLAMLVTCCSVMALFGYKRINDRNRAPCTDATITVDGKSMEGKAVCYAGRLAIFKIQGEGLVKVAWKFNDGSHANGGQIVSHKFIEEGNYKVAVLVNGDCSYEREITVKKVPVNGRTEKAFIEIFPEPAQPKEGSTVAFHAVANVPAHVYEWKLGSTGEVQHGAVATFTLNEAGAYSVRLMINNDPSTITTKVIEVFSLTAQPPELNDGAPMPGAAAPPPVLVDQGKFNPAQPTAQPGNRGNTTDTGGSKPPLQKPQPVEVDPDTFKGLLQDVLNENKEIQDLYEYLDYKGSTMVQVNGKQPLMALKDFCKNMKEKKKNKRKIETVSFKKDDKKSIQQIQVSVPESGGFWDKVNPFN